MLIIRYEPLAQIRGEATMKRISTIFYFLDAMIRGARERTQSELINALQHDDVVVRRWAVSALSKIAPGQRNLAPVLVKSLNDTDLEVRQSSALGLRRMGSLANTALLEALPNVDSEVRCQLTLLLGVQKDPGRDVLAALSEATNDDSESVRKAATLALLFRRKQERTNQRRSVSTTRTVRRIRKRERAVSDTPEGDSSRPQIIYFNRPVALAA